MKIFISSFILSISVLTHAQIGGDYSFSFLNLAENAKVASLGGELISGTDTNDVNNGYYNPANISANNNKTIGLNYLFLKQGIKKSSIVYTQDFNKIGPLNFSIQHIGYGEIESTDILGNAAGTINPQEYALSVGKSFTQNNFKLGTAIKFAGSSLGKYNSHAIMLDMGGTFLHPKKEFATSLLFKNLGFATDRYTESSDVNLPFQVVAGVTYKPKHMPIRFNFTAHNLQKWDIQYLDPNNTFEIDSEGNKIAEKKKFTEKLFRHLNVGAELMLSKSLQFRMGYSHLRRKELKVASNGGSGFSFGAMLRIKRFTFEFSKAYYFAGSGSAVLSVATNLNKIL